MRRINPVYATIALVLLCLILALAGGCQTADRRTPLDSEQRANQQRSTVYNIDGVAVFGAPELGHLADWLQTNSRNPSQTADSSIQGDSQQTAEQAGDASGETQQDQQTEVSPDVTLEPGP